MVRVCEFTVAVSIIIISIIIIIGLLVEKRLIRLLRQSSRHCCGIHRCYEKMSKDMVKFFMSFI